MGVSCVIGTRPELGALDMMSAWICLNCGCCLSPTNCSSNASPVVTIAPACRNRCNKLQHKTPYYPRPANRPAFGCTVPLFYQMSRVPLNHGNVPLFARSRIFFARVQFVTLPRCPNVIANHPFERNFGNSVRFLAKIPNGTAAESPCYSVFWNAIDFCRLYTSKKI